MSMKKIMTTALLLCTALLTVYGQNSILQKVNDIKKQTDVYYWAQYAHPIEDTAFVYATKWLMIYANLDEKDPSQLEEIKPLVKRIKIDANSKIRAFVYIKKSDVQMIGGMTNETTIEDNAIAADENATIVDTSTPIVPTPTPVSKAFVPDVFVQNIMGRKDIYQVYKFLQEQKSQGTVLQFGALKDVEDYNSLELVLFDMQSKEVISILSPVVHDNTRTNLMTGTPDSLDNYPEDMILAIWYIKN